VVGGEGREGGREAEGVDCVCVRPCVFFCLFLKPALIFSLPFLLSSLPSSLPPRRTYGLMGRIDFYDENRKRIVEVKVSDIDGILPSHETQTLLYALLYGNGWKPTRAFEVVNLLKGVRYKRVVRKEVKLWDCLKRGLEKLEFDEEMIETLGRMYGPALWEKQREEAAAAAAVATVLVGEAEGEGEEGVEGGEGAEDEGDELEEHAALLLTGKPQ